MDRAACTAAILDAKEDQGISFADLGAKIGRSEVWTAAAIYGQARMDAGEAATLCEILGLGPDVARALGRHPMKGSLGMTVPTDPLIYRLYEITQVYGTTIKAVVNEKFGDGIMSAIDLEVHVERVADPKGDRVQITLSGKYLPFRKW